MADLLNCPFCGGEAEIKRQGTPRVSMLYACTECGCELETGETGTAYLMWNRRAAQQDQGSDSRQAPLAWRHVKRGTVYTEIGRGKLQCAANELLDDKPVVIYRGEDGALWVRGVTEFEDGRFERVTSAAQFPSFTLPTKPSPIVSPHSEGVFPKIERCHADRDGDCNHPNCPQLRDGEPAKTGRHCPIDTWHEVDEE